MLRSGTLGFVGLLLAACATAAPNTSPSSVPTAPPTATATATAAPSASAPATATAGPTAIATATAPPPATPSGLTAEACGDDWFTSPAECGGEIGDRFLFQCPPGGRTTAIYGTDTYTDDSSACVAAVHAGLIGFDAGGAVTIELTLGLEAYVGSSRNGVDSNAWGSWPTAFVFVGGAGAVPTPSTGPGDPMAALLAHVPDAMRVDCHEVTTLSAGEVIAVQCTPPVVSGYITYTLFDTSDNLFDKYVGDFEYFGAGTASGGDCTVGPCQVAKTGATGLTEGRYFANNYTGIDPNGLIAYWFDESLLIEAGLAVYDTTFAGLYDLALQAGPNP